MNCLVNERFELPAILSFGTPGPLRDRLIWEWRSPYISPLLREIFLFWARLRYDKKLQTTRVTAIGRTRDERRGLKASWVHGDWRGIDGRILLLDGEPADWETEIRERVLERYPTGLPEMPRIGRFKHGTAPHGHIQVTMAEQQEWVRESGQWNGAAGTAP